MALTKYKLGELVELYNEKCGIYKLSTWDISGINSDKDFFEPSKQVGEDTSNYKNVPPNYFACNLMHIGRDIVLPIAYNHTYKTKVVSPAYTIFKIKDDSPVLKEYFFMMFKSNERDRYFWFHTDGSVRDGMTWEDFCNLELDIPPLPIQKKYVNFYNAMVANQQSYERGLEDLKLSFEILVDEYKHKATQKSVGDIFEEIDNYNSDGSFTNIQGINITKQFMPTVANTFEVNIRKYKIVKKGQFAFSGMQTGRDECIRIALYDKEEPIVISPAYTVIKIKDNTILPEYVMMWFSRKEVDRLGWFMSDGSIRTNLDMECFNEIKIPVPEIKVQKSIVDIYKIYKQRKSINEKLKKQIKDICPILIKGSIEEAKRTEN